LFWGGRGAPPPPCALVLGDIPSLRENWSGAALFVAPDDRTALARALRDLLGDEGRRREWARKAYERSREFPLSRTADDYVRLYETLVV
jgi:glycogen(starch) synthase